MRRLILSTVIITACSGLGAWAYFHGRQGVEYRTIPARTIPAARGNMDSAISATGNPNAVVTVQVGSQVSGNIMALYADFNSKVKAGQLIARIDPQIFQARVDAAQAAVGSARAAVYNAQANVQKSVADIANAQANVLVAQDNTQKAHLAVVDAQSKLGRRIQLANEGVLSKEDRETAQATYDQAVSGERAAQGQGDASKAALSASKAGQQIARMQESAAQAQVKQAEAALAQAQIDLDHTYIKAPVDGTVVSRQVNVGQTVAASLSAPVIFEIAQDLAKMQVDTNVDEADVGRVQVGQRATFTVDAYPNRVFRGAVTAVRQAPINVQNVVTYDVVIGVSNDDLKLFPGMTANVKILVDHRDNALKIPNAALRYRPAASTAAKTANTNRKARGASASQTIWTLGANGKPQPVEVQLGISDGTWTEVRSGNLQEGESVILGASSQSAPSTSATASPFGGGASRRGPGF
jgi:HlyD family secretion protein